MIQRYAAKLSCVFALAISVLSEAHAQTALMTAGQSAVTNTDEALPDAPADPATTSSEPPSGAVGGMGDVNLYPRRVVIAGRERSATVGLYNRATHRGEYDIVISDMMMAPDGRVVDLASVGDPALAGRVKVASPFLRWSPRKVALPPSEAQLVRIMVRIPPDLPDGEYRSHFTVVSVPPQGDGLSIEQAVGDQNGGVGVQIVPRFGISIPVIVRVGETTAQTALTDLAIVREAQPAVHLTIRRQGTRSVFGDLTVTGGGGKVVIGQIKGVGVYPEIAERSVQIPIDPKALPTLYASGASITVTFTDDDFSPGQILAKANFTVQ